MGPVPPPLTPDQALELGGWHPSYARVLRLHVEGALAIAVIDTNGDGEWLSVDGFTCTDGVWDGSDELDNDRRYVSERQLDGMVASALARARFR